MNDLRIFLEKIEGLPTSLEIIAMSEEKVDWLFKQINPTEIVFDSVPSLIEKNYS